MRDNPLRRCKLWSAIALSALGCALGPSGQVHAQTQAQIHLTTMLSLEETSGMRGLIVKTGREQPYLTCRGDEAVLTLFVALFDQGRMVVGKRGGSVDCGGRIREVAADVFVPIAQALSSAVRADSRAAANFIPGDQFLPRGRFTAQQYQSGGVVSGLSQELGVNLRVGTWSLLTVISSDVEATSTAWVILGRGR